MQAAAAVAVTAVNGLVMVGMAEAAVAGLPPTIVIITTGKRLTQQQKEAVYLMHFQVQVAAAAVVPTGQITAVGLKDPVKAALVS